MIRLDRPAVFWKVRKGVLHGGVDTQQPSESRNRHISSFPHDRVWDILPNPRNTSLNLKAGQNLILTHAFRKGAHLIGNYYYYFFISGYATQDLHQPCKCTPVPNHLFFFHVQKKGDCVVRKALSCPSYWTCRH